MKRSAEIPGQDPSTTLEGDAAYWTTRSSSRTADNGEMARPHERACARKKLNFYRGDDATIPPSRLIKSRLFPRTEKKQLHRARTSTS